MAKAVLRLAGGEALADALGDLTGLGQRSIQTLAAKGFAQAKRSAGLELRALTEDERLWAEGILVGAYSRLAARQDLGLARESLLGQDTLAAWVFGVGLDSGDKAALAGASEAAVLYFQLIHQGLARAVAIWYSESAAPIAQATAGAVAEVLATVRRMETSLGAGEPHVARAQDPSKASLLEAAIAALSEVPDYYPGGFRNERLAAGLRVVPIDEHQFGRFEGKGLYWDGDVGAEEVALTASSVRPSQLVAILGNPGSGKTTLAKGLVLDRLHHGELAIYCRLEDFAALAKQHPQRPDRNAFQAFGMALGASWDPTEADWSDELEKRPLIVLDGLDELATATDWTEARRGAATLARLGHPVVVTSRASGYSQPWTEVHEHFALAPLPPATADEFADEWFTITGDQVARENYIKAQGEASLNRILGSPLTLGFVCMLAHHGDVPLTPGRVFSRFLDHFLRGAWRHDSRKIVEPALVGRLKQEAELVALAMALHGPENEKVWVDVGELEELAEATASSAPYSVYASGLLVPHGPVEPLGSTQQRSRWLHRALQENLLAARLCRLVRRRDAQWWPSILPALCLRSWQGVELQMAQMLAGSLDLDWLIGQLVEKLNQGDFDGCIAGSLTVACRHSGSREARERAASALLQSGQWSFAAAADTATCVHALKTHLAEGRTDFPADLWWRLYEARAEGLEKLLAEASVARVDNDDLTALSNWLRLTSSQSSDIARRVEGLIQADAPPPWYLDPLPQPIVAAVTDVLADRLAATRTGSQLSLRRAYEIWSLAAGDRLDYTKQLPADRRLRLAVILGRKHDNMDHDLRPIRHLMTEPLADEDILRWGGRLAEQGFRVPAWDSVLGFITSRSGAVDWAEELPPLHLPITEMGTSLALALLNKASTEVGPLTVNQAESVLWALTVLCHRPTVDALRDLWALDRQQDLTARTATGSRPFHWLDANLLNRVLWAQPWQERAMSIRDFPTDDPAWDSTVLMNAAYIATFPYAENPKLSRLEAIDFYATGLTLWCDLSADDRPALHSYLELTSLQECLELASRVLPLAEAQVHLPTRVALIDNLARAIQYAGRLPDFFDTLQGARGGPEGARS